MMQLGPQAVASCLVWATLAASSTGCAKRTPLTPVDLSKVQTQTGTRPLRVYPSCRMLVRYAGAEKNAAFEVNREIRERSTKVVDTRITARKTPGLILDVDELNGKPLLYVTFDPECSARACAYQFVETEDEHYRLATPPAAAQGFRNDPEVYSSCMGHKRQLQPGKLAALQEANDVYLTRTRSGRIQTLELEIRKVGRDKTTTRTRKSRGIE